MENLQILVVEDHVFQRKMIVHMLHSLGIKNVRQAGNGLQALELMEVQQFSQMDIVLCDLDMPEMDGMEFLRHLSERQPNLSVVIMSSMEKPLITSVSKMAKSYGLRIIGAIEKPAALEQIGDFLNLHRQRSSSELSVSLNSGHNFTLDEVLLGLRQDQFSPFLQPKVNIKSGHIVGAEALARWHHPEHGVISPLAFIPLLECNGCMDEFTFMMLEKTAKVSRQLHDNGQLISLSVNLSLSSLSDTKLADKITKIVRDAGVDPHHIILEVTESAAMTSVAQALENLARLRMRGFGLSIDDYGTGFSSMQQLTRVPFTELKIDKSFISDCTNNHALRVIVESSIELARRLNVKSIAEGVENQSEWNLLREMNCDIVQGYFIAKPMSAKAFYDFCVTYNLRRKSAVINTMGAQLAAA